MELSAKYKTILYMGFRATLNFRKFKVALNPMYRTLGILITTMTLERFIGHQKNYLKSTTWTDDVT